jgi:hypothetical protein
VVVGDAVHVALIRVVPSRVALDERERVGGVAVHLVRAHEQERRLGAVASNGFEQVQGPGRVDLEIVEGTILGEVMRWLGGAVDEQHRPHATMTSSIAARSRMSSE